jgi:predicted nucleic acid-binding protein
MSWCLKDSRDDFSDSILDMLSTREAVVPIICPFEVANVLLVAERRRRLTQADTGQFLTLLTSLPIRIDHGPQNLALNEILVLGRQYGLSAYDAAYLELAIREGLPLVTRDTALRGAASRCGIKKIT